MHSLENYCNFLQFFFLLNFEIWYIFFLLLFWNFERKFGMEEIWNVLSDFNVNITELHSTTPWYFWRLKKNTANKFVSGNKLQSNRKQTCNKCLVKKTMKQYFFLEFLQFKLTWKINTPMNIIPGQIWKWSIFNGNIQHLRKQKWL